MRSQRKTKTFLFNGLGFPITLVNAPMRKVFGEWILDINMEVFQLAVLRILVHKANRLTKDELRFFRKYLSLTTTEFGKIFGVSHVAVLRWEKGQRQVTPAIEFYIRLYMLNHLQAKDREFRNLYNEIPLEKLSSAKTDTSDHLKIDVSEDLKIA